MAVQETLVFLLSLLVIVYCEEECSQENSYLWKVDTQPPLYLFGTMHVPYTKLWNDIPENVKTAFSSCDEICLELRLSDADTRQELADCQYLPGNVETVEEVLSKEMVERIEAYFQSIKQLFSKWVPSGSSLLGGTNSDAMFNAITADWKKKRPIWILMLISSLSEENIQNRNIPLLDIFMENVAEGLGKKVQAIETPRDQCRPLNKISNEKVELALRVQLDYLERQLTKNFSEVNQGSNIHTYRCGDFGKLVLNTPFLPLPPLENITTTSPGITPNETAVLRSVEEYLWNQMVIRRNRRMANGIHELLSNARNKTFFIALGAGHYLSNSNVIQRLKRKGHKVEHISVHTQIDGPALPSDTIQLGDPSTRVRSLVPTEGKETSLTGHPTLSPEAHQRIWSNLQQPKNPVEPSNMPTEQRNARQTPLLTDVEVMEMSPSHEQSISGSSSILYGTQLSTILLLALAAVSLGILL